jgi:hypothetical protein
VWCNGKKTREHEQKADPAGKVQKGQIRWVSGTNAQIVWSWPKTPNRHAWILINKKKE